MIDESDAVSPLWMLLSATFGFMIGEALGGHPGFGSTSRKLLKISANSSNRSSPTDLLCNELSTSNATSSTTSIGVSSL